VLLAAEGLQPSSKGARVRFSGEKRTVTDGPFTEAKELIAGFWLWQVKSKEEAIEWVKRCPNPTGTEGEIEIRQVFEAEDFGAESRPSSGRQRSACANTSRNPVSRRARSHSCGALRRRSRRGSRVGHSRHRARAVAGVGCPGPPGRLAHSHREASSDRSLASKKVGIYISGGLGPWPLRPPIREIGMGRSGNDRYPVPGR